MGKITLGIKIAKAAYKGIKAIKKKIKSKHYQSQFDTTGSYGEPAIKNIIFKSKKSLSAIEKRMNKGGNMSSHLGTSKISKNKFQIKIKEKKLLNVWKQQTKNDPGY
tara:strand:+ start:710 stop:1030 length:321 start_codon:yes stop_codon:yes gene_type:complete